MQDIEQSIQLIKTYYEKFGNGIYVATSGGKDSGVILDLALQVIPHPMIIHNPKPETHHCTIKLLYELSQKHTIHYVPSKEMEQFIISHNLKCQIDGTRISEFTRTDKSSDLIVDGKNVSRENMTNVANGIWGITNIYPIYDWQDDDVFSYTAERGILLSDEYRVGY